MVSFLSGGASGSIITIVVSGYRDKRQRRRAFSGFLRSWRAEIASVSGTPGGLVAEPGPTILYRPPKDLSLTAYRDKLPHFHDEIERARDCFADTQGFKFLTDRLGGLKEEDWKDKRAQDIILKALDELIAFIT